ncbi:hypothetical protein KIH86_17755 [Paenibacillus sp. HN-1]|uniref:hypothetical protein n=1 Tax=Paenibacillus TaxID=44249 RepID=UPI001CA9F176|nr:MULTISPECIES: hypothetical protein [Paenibacillus]MBY9078285.1 hypothetical protein [Paenibacillus sp. CGMCC 1.18879]MBY9086056.1 hypothetical protein [Paenibacillus sinensis]
MKTTSEVATFIKSSPELVAIIHSSNAVNDVYSPKSPLSSTAGLALKYFWSGYEGVQFRFTFERVSGRSIWIDQLRSRLKDAVLTLIVEYRIAKGLSD